MVMALGLENPKALIYVTHKMQINSWTFHGPVFPLHVWFPVPTAKYSCHIPFLSNSPSVIKGHLGMILFLNLAFGGITCSRSVYIYVYKLLGPEQSKTNGPPSTSSSCSFANCLLTPCHSYSPQTPSQYHI